LLGLRAVTVSVMASVRTGAVAEAQFEGDFEKKRVPLAFQGSLKVHQIPRKTKYSTEKETLSLLDAIPRKL
jgi:hypothetical protein